MQGPKLPLPPSRTPRLRAALPLLALLLPGALALPGAAQAGEVYKWKDASGHVYFSDRVPPEAEKKAQAVRLNNVAPSGTPAPDPRATGSRDSSRTTDPSRISTRPEDRSRIVTKPDDPSRVVKQGDPQKVKTYEESINCYAQFRLNNGAMRAGAEEACGPAVSDPGGAQPR